MDENKTLKQKFVEKHQSEFGTVTTGGGWVMFSDGAAMESAAYGVLRDVPEDPYEAAKLVVRFWEAKLSRATKEFDSVKENMIRTVNADVRAGYSPICTQQAAMPKLKELKAEEVLCSEKLSKAATAVEAAKPKGEVSREQRDMENQADAQKAFNAINEII